MLASFNKFTKELLNEVKEHMPALRAGGAIGISGTSRDALSTAIMAISNKFSINPLEVRNVFQGQFDSLRAGNAQKRRKANADRKKEEGPADAADPEPASEPDAPDAMNLSDDDE